jgi:hypothetical protein
MLVTKNWIEKNYNKFNKLYWDGKLPVIEFKISRSRNTWGFASFRYDYANDTIHPLALTLSNYYDSPENVKINTLLHEMIHIADYTFHPEHFIRNGRRVTGHYYDAHGYWFQSEAKRIEKFGWTISKHVTNEEQKISKLSEHSEKCLTRKKDVALICVIRGTSGMNFYFKTDIYKVKDVKATIKRYNFYYIGEVRKIEFYTFDDEKLAVKRSCGKNLRGWFLNNEKMLRKLESIKATTVKF